MNLHHALRHLVAAGACLLAAGCTTYHASEKATYELRRNFNGWETIVSQPIEEVHRAVEAGLADLGVEPIVSRADKLTGKVDGTFSDGSDYTVSMKALGKRATQLRIRCGVIGDRERAKRLFGAFEKHW